MDQYVPGIFDSPTLHEILRVLFTDEEAELAALMPLDFTTPAAMAKKWRCPESDARAVLDRLASKGLVYATPSGQERRYALAPPVLGFFEFSLMRTDGRFDRKLLSGLYHRYINEEGDFVRQFGSTQPPITRVLPQEDALEDLRSEVLTHDRVSAGIDAADCITVGTCFCRHKMEHVGKACAAPQDVCMTFNGVAEFLAEQGIARRISRDQAHAVIRRCMEHGLMQIGDNARSELVIICNCCGCCCDLLLGYKRFGLTGIVSPSAFEARVKADVCAECGTCVERCPVDAVRAGTGVPTVDPTRCLGCGVCARFCPSGACHMAVRPRRPYVPQDFFEKVGREAIWQGKLGNFICPDQTSMSHRIGRSVVSTLTGSGPVRRFLLRPGVSTRLIEFFRRRRRWADVARSCPAGKAAPAHARSTGTT
jgi:Pyruvate/2-oxoacid:ferredoxin oxidoreductase delta subunit